MSRIGKKPIVIPEKTEVKIEAGILTVKGPLGILTRKVPPFVKVEVENGLAKVTAEGAGDESSMYWGTWASHLANMVAGVNKLFEKKLIVEGIGFKYDVRGEDLVMSLGFSHPVKVKIPKDLKVSTDKNFISISGCDIEKVGTFAAYVRSKKKPEPYKGKGIRYDDEVIRRKEGKKTA
jgi:large subunit ribosomal protein L6